MGRDLRQEGKETTPSASAETPPKNYPGADYNWTVQAMFEMQNSLGRVEQAISGLTDQVKTQGGKLDTISHKISLAQGAVWVIGGIITILLLLTKLWDVIGPLLKSHP